MTVHILPIPSIPAQGAHLHDIRESEPLNSDHGDRPPTQRQHVCAIQDRCTDGEVSCRAAISQQGRRLPGRMIHAFRDILTILFTLLIMSCSPPEGERSPHAHAAGDGVISIEMEREIQSIRMNGKLPALQVAVVSGDRIVSIRSMGERADAMHLIGSVEKVFTATAILQLYETGFLGLDDDVNRYLPAPMRHPRYPDVPITIRVLLSHRSGLEMFRNQADWDTRFLTYHRDSVHVPPPVAFLSQEKFLQSSLDPSGENFDSSAWHFRPGENYLYSNSGYLVLKQVIERVSGTTYGDYLNEHIFTPLDMRHTTCRSDDPSRRYAVPYTRNGLENITLPAWAGGRDFIWSTAEDLARFMIAQLDSGRIQKIRILKPETIALMREPHSPGRSLFRLGSMCPYSSYGFGIIHYSGDWFGHGGSTIGFQSLFAFNTSTRNGYVILTNVNGLIHGQKNFDAVWASVSAVERLIKPGLGPSAYWRYLALIPVGAGILLLIILIRRRRRAAKEKPRAIPS